jgi:hypothetical protein
MTIRDQNEGIGPEASLFDLAREPEMRRHHERNLGEGDPERSLPGFDSPANLRFLCGRQHRVPSQLPKKKRK